MQEKRPANMTLFSKQRSMNKIKKKSKEESGVQYS